MLLGWNVDGLLHWWNEAYGQDAATVTDVPTVFFWFRRSQHQCGLCDSRRLRCCQSGRPAFASSWDIGVDRPISVVAPRSVVPGPRPWKMRCGPASFLDPSFESVPTKPPKKPGQSSVNCFPAGRGQPALFCHNDVMAFGAFRGLRDMDLRVPQDVSLLGFDNAWAAEYLDPPLTTVVFPYHEIIDQSLTYLLNRLAGTARQPQQVLLPGTLVVPRVHGTAKEGRCQANEDPNLSQLKGCNASLFSGMSKRLSF